MKGYGFIGKNVVPLEEYFYTIFRVIIGFLFFMHGSGKLGWFTGKAGMTAGSLMWFVGLLEVTAGLLILIGLFTRLGAIIGAIVMISALIKAHIPKGWNPMSNGGELALIFLIVFLVIIIHGSGKFGLEYWMKKKECI